MRGVPDGAVPRTAPRLSRGLQAAFAAALAVVVIAAVVSYRNTLDLVATSRWVAHTHEVREQLASALSALQDAETGQRGYVIMGDRSYLAPYEVARKAVPQRMARLRALLADNPVQQRAAGELGVLVERRLGLMRQAIRRRKHADFAGARAVIMTGIGARAMQAVRESVGRMQANENDLLHQRVHAANAAAWTASATFAVAATLAVTLIALLYHLVARALRERAANETKLRTSEHRFRRVVESNMIGILFWRGGEITDANDALLDVLGYTRDDVRQGRLSWQSIISPEHVHLTERALDEIRAGGVCPSYETEVVRADGRRLPVICAGAALDHPYAGVGVSWLVDISEPKRVESELRESVEVIDTVNRMGQRLAADLDLGHLVQEVTDAATRLTGAKFGAFFYNVVNERGEAYMLYTLSGAPREAFARFPMPRNTAVFEPTFRGAGPIRLVDVKRDPRYGGNPPYHGMPPGHLPVASYLAVPVVSRSGEVLGGLFFGHPQPGVFTERAERIAVGLAAQAAIAIDNARLYDAERNAREAAEAASRAKDEFLSVVSHELRTPLASMTNWLRVLRTGKAERSARAIDAIDRAARAQAKLVDDLLDVSRIVTGRLRLDLRPVDLSAVIRAAVETISPTAEAKGVRLTVRLDAGLGSVAGDPDRLQQIAWNLLSNAMKFTPSGESVEVRLEPLDGHVRFVVRDTGRGISPEFLPRVFDRFQQAEPAASRRHGGLGLGLAIVRHLTELHGGTVAVESAGEGKGATFTVTLPRIAEGSAIAGRDGNGADAEALPRLDGLRVLLVRGEADACALLRQMLEEQGAAVTIAASADQARAALRDAEHDVLVTDAEADPDLLAAAGARQLPAVALMSARGAEERSRVLAAGDQVRFAKRVEPRELVAAIAELTAPPPTG